MGDLGKRGGLKLKGRKWGLWVFERRKEEMGLRVGRGMGEEEREKERVFMVLEREGMERNGVFISFGELGNRKWERDFQVERWDFDFGGKHLKW